MSHAGSGGQRAQIPALREPESLCCDDPEERTSAIDPGPFRGYGEVQSCAKILSIRIFHTLLAGSEGGAVFDDPSKVGEEPKAAAHGIHGHDGG